MMKENLRKIANSRLARKKQRNQAHTISFRTGAQTYLALVGVNRLLGWKKNGANYKQAHQRMPRFRVAYVCRAARAGKYPITCIITTGRCSLRR